MIGMMFLGQRMQELPAKQRRYPSVNPSPSDARFGPHSVDADS
jgi:hypothetical protein